MLWVYKLMFLVGLIYAAVSFVLGNLLDFAGVDLGGELDSGSIDLDGDGEIDLGSGSSAGGWTYLLPLQPLTLVSFITVFGGFGIIGNLLRWHHLVIFGVALVTAWFTAQLLYRLIIVPLRKVQVKNELLENSAVGARAQVISPIYENGFGTISYVVEGSRFTSPAKHMFNRQVAQGREVVVCRIDEKRIFWVEDVYEEGKEL